MEGLEAQGEELQHVPLALHLLLDLLQMPIPCPTFLGILWGILVVLQ